MPVPVRWLGQNLGTLFLAFVLAVVVWVSAVSSQDPMLTSIYGRTVPIEVRGQTQDMVIIGDVVDQVRVTIRAPESVWNNINTNPGLIHAWIDLSGLEAGTHNLPVEVQIDNDLARVTQWDPQTVEVQLDQLISQETPVHLDLSGSLPQGYERGGVTIDPITVTVTGPAIQVSKVIRAEASMDISNDRETREANLVVRPVDPEGNQVAGVTVSPRSIHVVQPITQKEGYKTVAVWITTEGNVANGYRVTNLSVTPPVVVIFSSDPQRLNDVPGYIQTRAIDLTGKTDDFNVATDLDLGPGIEMVDQQSVLVQVSIAAIESSQVMAIPIETQGLPPEWEAVISPERVNVIVEGPLPFLDTLEQSSFRVLVDLTGLAEGTYQLTPVIDLAPEEVHVASFQPEVVEVTIRPVPTPTPTPQANRGEDAVVMLASRLGV